MSNKIITISELVKDPPEELGNSIDLRYREFKIRLLGIDQFPNRGELQMLNRLIDSSWKHTLKKYRQISCYSRKGFPEHKICPTRNKNYISPFSPDDPYSCHLQCHLQYRRY